MLKTGKKILIITIVLTCAVLLFAGKVSARELKQKAYLESAPDNADQLKEKTDIESIRPRVKYDAAGLRDPFRRYNESGSKEVGQQPLPALVVTGVVWGTDIPQAIINDKVVRQGDSINDVKIIEINKEGISVVFQGRQYNVSSPAGSGAPKKVEGGEND